MSNMQSEQPRGRGKKNRGRGRGSQSSPNIVIYNNTPPSFETRAAQVKVMEGAPPTTSTPPPAPLAQISAAMDAYFPTSMQPTLAPRTITVSSRGFCDISREVYETITSLDPHLKRILSPAEYLLCSGQVMAKDLIRKYILSSAVIFPGYEKLMNIIGPQTKLPLPQLLYFEGIGTLRTPLGDVVYPAMLIPSYESEKKYLGLEPTHITDMTSVNTKYAAYMVPFGVLKKWITLDHTIALDKDIFGHADFNLKISDDAEPYEQELKSLFDHPERLPGMRDMPRRHRDHTDHWPFYEGDDILGAICYNPELFRRFDLFVTRAARVISTGTFSLESGGTPAQLVIAEPQDGTKDMDPSQFEYSAYSKLSSSEQQAARLFRYREHIKNADLRPVADASVDTPMATDPDQHKLPTQRLTPVMDYYSFLGHFVNHFVLIK